MLVTTSIEGAIIVARASRDVKPLDLVQRQLRALLQAETRRKEVLMTGEWQSTACILCECNCGIVVQTRGPHARQDPR